MQLSSIKAKVYLLVFCTAVVSASAILSYTLWVLETENDYYKLSSTYNRVLLTSERIASIFKSNIKEVEIYAQTPMLKSMEPKQFHGYLINELIRHNHRFEKFIVGTKTGEFYNTSGGNPGQGMLRTQDDNDPNARPLTLVNRNYWQKAVKYNDSKSTDAFVSNPMVSYTTGAKQVVITSAIENNDEVVGMLGATIDWQHLLNLIESATAMHFNDVDWQPQLFLIAEDGTYWYHWDPEMIVKPMKDENGEFVFEDGHIATQSFSIYDSKPWQLGQKFKQHKNLNNFYFKYKDDRGKPYYLFASDVQLTGYTLGLIVSKEDITPLNIDFIEVIWLSILGLCILMLVAMYWYRANISYPLNQLMDYVRSLQEENYNEKYSNFGKDELGEIGRTLKELATSVLQREKENKALNKKLARKVEERTGELQEANDKLKRLTRVDQLTEIGNRRAMEDDLAHTFALYKRHNTHFSVLLADIDYFKKYNDNYGHQPGDVVLKEVAQLIDDSLRQEDSVYRYGGEEFLIILPQLDAEQALEAAKRLTEQIFAHQIPHQFSPLKAISISVGVAICQDSDKSWAPIALRADRSLYQAKNAGRNCAIYTEC